eukprot:14730897-Alexandrium_andersonii.AAC.1
MQFVADCHMPLCVVGDWNMTPQEFADTQFGVFLARSGLQLRTIGTQATCWSGRHIDFAFVSAADG